MAKSKGRTVTRRKLREGLEEEFQAATALPLWREALLGIDWISLRVSPVFRGSGIPTGDGTGVVVVPGFMGSDQYLGDMNSWLRRINYTPFLSGIGRNADCPDVLLEILEERVASIAGETGRPVTLIGHSLGGIMARALAVKRPEIVSQVITLGAPVRPGEVHPLVLSLIRAVARVTPSPEDSPRAHGDHYHCGTCSCDLAAALDLPFPADVPRASIYSKNDGVVDWRSAVDDAPGVNVPVNSTHVGMTVSREVYEAVADLLASASEISYPMAA